MEKLLQLLILVPYFFFFQLAKEGTTREVSTFPSFTIFTGFIYLS